jgi:hypothetical protein
MIRITVIEGKSMILKIVPINLITSPNFWSPTKDTFWQVTGAQATDLFGCITILDNLGQRVYVPASGSSLVALFQRGDLIGTNNNLHQTVTKVCTLDNNLRSLTKISLTAADATNIISGTVVFTLTEGLNIQKWTQNYAVKKLNTGAGC